MPLTVGTHLGPFEVIAPLGAGGMGEVYRARDSRIGREVAIKVLPASFAQDEARLKRFEHEARVVGALNHPNLLTLHDVGTSDTTPYLVSELLEGMTLREVLASEPPPVRKAVDYAVQTARGLAAAHEKGVIHRDLKPDNLFVTRDGRLKILDFGLAKLARPEDHAVFTEHETATSPTTPGTILGTVGYMSPEQARGVSVDHRSDLFSLGAVLYELLAGRRAFQGETGVETLAAILRQDPPELPAERGVAPALDRIVRRCLEKRPEERFQSAHDLAFALENVSGTSHPGTAGGGDATSGMPLRQGTLRTVNAAALVLAAAAFAFILGRVATGSRGRVPQATRWTLRLPAKAPLSTVQLPFALSDEGRYLAYVRAMSREQASLWLRPFDQFEPRPLAGTEGAYSPFVSPDGQWIGFWANGKLRKIPAAGGALVTICDSPPHMGASWAPDGTIVFAPGPRAAIHRVSAEGGRAEPITVLDAKRGEVGHRSPQVLPGGRAVLFTIHDQEGDRIAVQPLPTGERRILLEGAGTPRYAGSGHVVYAREGALYAVPFDLGRLEVRGASARVVDSVIVDPRSGEAWFRLSSEGSLAFVPEPASMASRALISVGRDGSARALGAGPRAFGWPRISPDGRRVAFTTTQGSGELFQGDVWIYETTAESFSRLTFKAMPSQAEWSRDGSRVTYTSLGSDGTCELLRQPADGTAPAERLLKSDPLIWPGSWLPDGRALVYMTRGPGGSGDILLLRTPGEEPPQPLAQGSANEWGARISPDGRWLAYVSDESGRFEVYVQPLAGSGTRHQISTEGGQEAVWSRDGRELFYRSDKRMMAVTIGGGTSPAPGRPRLLFEGRYALGIPGIPNYDVGPDGRFLMIQLSDEEEQERGTIHIVLDWLEELRRRVPEAR